MKIDRRRLMTLAFMSGFCARADFKRNTSADNAAQILSNFDHLSDLTALGTACLIERPTWRKPPALVLYRRLASWVGAPIAEPDRLFHLIPTRVAIDFEAGDTETVQG